MPEMQAVLLSIFRGAKKEIYAADDGTFYCGSFKTREKLRHMNPKLKGTVYERKIMNQFISIDPENRIAMRGAGSMSRGDHKIDLILIDIKQKQINLIQCKNAKGWPESRKMKHTASMQMIFNGDYFVNAAYL